MLEHGALAAISLDDIMAVQIPRETDLEAGQRVTVLFSDDTEARGRVEKNLEGILTVTVEDDDYAVGQTVTVISGNGQQLGTGQLYIFNQWNATAYSGTISDVLVKEGATLRAGQSLFRVDDPGHTSEFQRLIDKRHDYEEMMAQLFEMYRTESITAPCDGIVTDVDKDGAFLLSAQEKNWAVQLLTSLTHRDTDRFFAYPVQVAQITGSGMELKLDDRRVWVDDLADLSAITANPAKMTRSWQYSGNTTVYTQGNNGILCPDGTANPGDILLAVGNQDSVLWFVRAEASEEEEGFRAQLLSAVEETEPAPIVLQLSTNQGTVKESFSATLTATQNGTALNGTWSLDYSASAGWLTLSGNVLSGTPEEEGVYSASIGFTTEGGETTVSQVFSISIAAPAMPQYMGITAVVIGIDDGVLLVKQSPETIVINDPTNLPPVNPNLVLMTEPASYLSNLIKAEDIAEDDILLLILNADGSLHSYLKLNSPETPGQMPDGDIPGGFPGGGIGGGMGGIGGMGGMGGMAEEEDDGLYSLEKLTVASVTSQEHMTVEITIDELDIIHIDVGQTATVTLNALVGESYTASVTRISNSGENEGGNSKFSVELTLDKSGDMLPGMSASASIVLDTQKDVPCISVAALSEENGKTVVYTGLDSETGLLTGPVEVTLGAADADYVQILSGLEAGDTICYAYYDQLPIDDTPDFGGMGFGR